MAPDARQRSILERLTVVGNSVLAELDLETVLGYVVEAARDLTGAQYAALGVLDDEGQELERFIHRGIDGQTREEIGALPRGRGVLGELIREPKPLRMPDVEAHPHAYGFPPGHPPMRSFLGVPVYIGDQIYGNLYLTEKRDAVEFDADDEEAVIVLASWAGIAIKNARLHTVLRGREKQLEVALRRSEAALEIARVIGGETDVNRVVELIVKRARALIEAKTVLVLLRHGDVLDVFAQAGVAGRELAGESIPIAPFRAAIEDHRASLVPAGAPLSEARLRERVGAASALVVPLLFRGTAVGVLVAFDRETGEFDDEDLHLLESFAGSAATAIGTAHVQTAESL